jgi:AbrB family looped-hinge helix DNA binding protein
MSIAQSKLTAQGQISVPSEIRKKLGVGPGSVIEWDERNNEVIVRRAGKHTSEDVHEALFSGESQKQKKPPSVRNGIKKYIQKKHARG